MVIFHCFLYVHQRVYILYNLKQYPRCWVAPLDDVSTSTVGYPRWVWTWKCRENPEKASLVLLIRQSRHEKWLAIIGNINPTFSDKPSSDHQTSTRPCILCSVWTCRIVYITYLYMNFLNGGFNGPSYGILRCSSSTWGCSWSYTCLQ